MNTVKRKKKIINHLKLESLKVKLRLCQRLKTFENLCYNRGNTSYSFVLLLLMIVF